MTQPMMSLQDISFAYENNNVLENISCDIQPGEFIGVIGPNGSGKSTLLKLMVGILRSASGRMNFKGTELVNYKKKLLAQSIAWISQDNAMVFPFKISEIVLMGRHPYLSPLTFEGEEDRQIALKAMELTETTSFADRRFDEISGGEKQRVMMASAIAQEPEMMLLDEPTSALDLKFQIQVLRILDHLNREREITLVMAIHDLHLASKFCRRLILLNEGKIVKDGTVDEVLQKEILEDVYGIGVKLIRDPDDGSIIVSPEG